uniref:Uncharacterized protein n=1 Tax=Conchiformibius kuhniae TaxID=211502 RepID=A0A8T9MX11_9NEIS|nr:hypothetical protein LVJ77_01170 [Conchiformibius kuhniae]
MFLFQPTGQHIKHGSMLRPDSDGSGAPPEQKLILPPPKAGFQTEKEF